MTQSERVTHAYATVAGAHGSRQLDTLRWLQYCRTYEPPRTAEAAAALRDMTAALERVRECEPRFQQHCLEADVRASAGRGLAARLRAARAT